MSEYYENALVVQNAEILLHLTYWLTAACLEYLVLLGAYWMTLSLSIGPKSIYCEAKYNKSIILQDNQVMKEISFEKLSIWFMILANIN